MRASWRCRWGATSAWNVSPVAPALAKSSKNFSGSTTIRWTSSGNDVRHEHDGWAGADDERHRARHRRVHTGTGPGIDHQPDGCLTRAFDHVADVEPCALEPALRVFTRQPDERRHLSELLADAHRER